MGGLITASISYIGTYMDPLLGAIWWSFPISLIPTIYFMKDTGKSNKFIAQFTISTTYSLVLLFISCFFMGHYLNTSDDIAMPIIKAIGVWFIASVIFYTVIKRFKLDTKFI
tara:strand:- start:703 stop:1038 length:336 start_codon:yes stop_codon:yes gene_type:complete